MPGRVLERKRRRLPCAIRSCGQRYSGIVLELSASGVFVQTSARGAAGSSLEIEVGVPSRPAPISLTVEVVRQNCVPAQLRSVAQGGIGARITHAPEAFYEYLLSLDPIVEESKCETERNFQVRARQVGGPRTKRLFLTADDTQRARSVAVEHLGEAWDILDAIEVVAS